MPEPQVSRVGLIENDAMNPSGSVEELRSRLDGRVLDALRVSAERGFLGGMPLEHQVDHALGFVLVAEAALGGSPDSLVDLGSGGGVPGLALISCWPDCRVVLLDANERRTTFLQEIVDDWDRPGECTVTRGRAEDIGHEEWARGGFHLVTSRSFGAPAVTAECGAALLAEGGVMVVSEPPGEDPAERWPNEGLGLLGLRRGSTLRIEDRFGYQTLLFNGPLEGRYPRRVGIPAKRPLF